MRASLCRADRQGDAVGCRVRLSPLPSGDCHCGGFKNKAELSTSKYAAGNNPVLGKIRTRSINRSLLGLLSIIFDCWEENFAREKPKPPFTPPSFSFTERPEYITWQVQGCSLQLISLSYQLYSAHPLYPLLLRSTGKNFLQREEKK